MDKSRKILTNPMEYHVRQFKNIVPSMAFDENSDYLSQKKAISEKFRELINMPEKKTSPVALIEHTDDSDERFDEIRFTFESEPGFFIPAHMLLPKERKGKIPAVICLQGHSEGMHISLARKAFPDKTPITVEGDRDFCIQAVKRGYVAIALEQRGFGELCFKENANNSCHELSWQAVLMGRTLIGERIFDISRLIDALEVSFDFIDMTKIGVMGNSGGGTSSYFAACVDKRIKVAMPSSSFCTFKAAWGSIYHCDCGYVPGIIKYMEMPDMALMIAPRKLVVVNGIYDNIQPFAAAKESYKTVEKIYERAGASENCTMVEGDEGHRFYADKAWGIFDSYMKN